MKQVRRIIMIVVLPLMVAIPFICNGQYFNNVYDFDSAANSGLDVFIQTDSGGNYLIFGHADNNIYGYNGLMYIAISEDGNTVINEHYIDTSDVSGYYMGNPGAVKQLPDGGYVIPITMQTYYTDTTQRSAVGIIRLNSSLDTVFTKLYTDTAVFYEVVNDCALMPDGGFLLAGGRGGNANTGVPPVLSILIRTDSLGDTLWTRTYANNSAIDCEANTIEALSNGNILLGAENTTPFIEDAAYYFDNQPWFVILDSAGNILKDTLYGARYGGGGYIYTDVNGGYYHYGYLDSFLSSDYSSYDNFPGYVAHLDDNFRVQWFRLLGGVHNFYGVFRVNQLADSDYLVVAENEDSLHNEQFSSLTKIDRSGNIIWQQQYIKDTEIGSYAYDAAIRANGSIVFTGYSFNEALPGTFRQNVWLVSLDSNGCEVPGCSPLTTTNPLLKTGRGVTVFPNPTSGEFTVNAPSAGALAVYNIQGQAVAEYKVNGGANSLSLPGGLSAGVYVCRYIVDGNNNMPTVVRLVYEP